MLDFDLDDVFSDLEDSNALEHEFIQELSKCLPSFSVQLLKQSGQIFSAGLSSDIPTIPDFTEQLKKKTKKESQFIGNDQNLGCLLANWVEKMDGILFLYHRDYSFTENKAIVELAKGSIDHALLVVEYNKVDIEKDQLNRQLGVLKEQHNELVENNHKQYLLLQEKEKNYAKDLENEIAKRTAELRKVNEELREASRLKSEFLANMSHELRTPMNAIIGFSELLSGSQLNEEQADYAETINQSGSGLLSLINDILDFAKIEAGKLDMMSEPFILLDVVKNVAAMFAKPALDKKITLTYNIDNEIPLRLIGDGNRLKQILVNLCGNAMKFTENGDVKILLSCMKKGKKSCTIRFIVSDTGIGIKRDRQASIFEKFTQEDGSTTRKYGGTGLGLTITSQLVEMMGGYVFLCSEAGKGSSFSFVGSFSVAEQQADSVKEASQSLDDPSDVKGSFRVLLVEDNLVNQKLASILIKRQGGEVEIAGDGIKALAKLKEMEFDLVLMDLQMPNMDGLEATKRIRAIEGSDEKNSYAGLKQLTAPVPVVGLSAHAKKEDADEAVAAGMNDF